jgi:uncharacterized protein (DUF2235 family)
VALPQVTAAEIGTSCNTATASSPLPPGKAIVICCDGTANSPEETEDGQPSPTNVYRLYKALSDDGLFGQRQVTWYDAGVGTGSSSFAKLAQFVARAAQAVFNSLPKSLAGLIDKVLKAIESATGIWIEENIAQGYREIVRNYVPGDRICIFGFSRGAYTARCIAGVIEWCGLLRAENIRFSDDVIALYRRRRHDAEKPILDLALIHPTEGDGKVQVHMLGLWDTVASLGLPLWGWWFRLGAFWRNRELDSNPAKLCRNVYHALSMDEHRSQFFPTLTIPGRSPDKQGVTQVWLRGAHADVGGGYVNRALGDISLEWMLQAAHREGLEIRRDIPGIAVDPSSGLPTCPKADAMGLIHDEIKKRPAWIVFGSWPRWPSVPRPDWSDEFQERCITLYGQPHPRVQERARRAAELWSGRPLPAGGSSRAIEGDMACDGLVFLAVGSKATVRAFGASVWNRGAVVFESAGIYRIRRLGGEWRDAGEPACGPEGQPSGGLLRDPVRRLLGWLRRVRGEDWMRLFGHVAHPRLWPVHEFGFWRLLLYFFWREPAPLARSLIPLGRHMKAGRDSVYVANFASNGVFHCFANDAWATYDNNSGAIDLEIERVASIPAGAPWHAITPRGDVVDESDPTAAQLVKLAEQRSRLLQGRQADWPPEARPALGGTATGVGAAPDSLAAGIASLDKQIREAIRDTDDEAEPAAAPKVKLLGAELSRKKAGPWSRVWRKQEL